MSELLAFAAAGLVALWGVAHAVPTRAVLAGFDPPTRDDRLILLQEWLVEAFTMWGAALLVVVVTLVGAGGSEVVRSTYLVAAALMIALAALTSVTGARTSVVWFKVCPAVQCTAAALLVAASLL